MRELTFNITEDKRFLVEPTNVENFNLTFDKQNWVQGRVGEDSLRQVFVNVVTGPNNEPYDLTGINPEFDGLTPKGGEDNRNYVVIDNHHSVMIDAQGGRFRFDFPREAFAIAGSYKQAFFSLKREGTGEVVATLEFDMKVMANFVYETVKAVDYITPFDDVLDQLLEKYKQGNADREEQFNQFITNIQTQYNTIKSQFESSEALADAMDQRLRTIEAKINADNLFTNIEAVDFKTFVNAQLNSMRESSDSKYQSLNDKLNSTETTLSSSFANAKEEFDQKLTNYQSEAGSLYDSFTNNVRNLIDEKMLNLTENPKALANAAAIQDTYPNGTAGVVIAADTGHKWVYINGSWVDAGVYQTAGLTADVADLINSSSTKVINFESQATILNADDLTTGEQYTVYIPVADLKKAATDYNFPLINSYQMVIGYLKIYDLKLNNSVQQVFVTTAGVFTRTKIGSGTYANWINLSSNRAVKIYQEDLASNLPPNADELLDDALLNLTGAHDLNYPKKQGLAYLSNHKAYGSNNQLQELKFGDGMTFIRQFVSGAWSSWMLINSDKLLRDLPITNGYVDFSNNLDGFSFDDIKTPGKRVVLNNGNPDQYEAVGLPRNGRGNTWGIVTTLTLQDSQNMVQKYDSGLQLFTRIYNAANASWGGWVSNQSNNQNNFRALSAFRKFAVVGDSLTVGKADNSNDRNEWYSWPQYLARRAGNSAVNLGTTGDTVLSWWSTNSANGKDKAIVADNKAQAYVIELSRNDVNLNVPLGTTGDIVNDTSSPVTTFYGGYSRIINYLNSINPDAAIICLTDPGTMGSGDAYAQAIRDIANDSRFASKVLLVDLHNGSDASEYSELNSGFTFNTGGGHPNQVGYTAYADWYDRKIGSAWRDSVFRQKNIASIPFGGD